MALKPRLSGQEKAAIVGGYLLAFTLFLILVTVAGEVWVFTVPTENQRRGAPQMGDALLFLVPPIVGFLVGFFAGPLGAFLVRSWIATGKDVRWAFSGYFLFLGLGISIAVWLLMHQ